MTQPRPLLHAFIDEAGQRSSSAKSSNHFVMSAVLAKDEDLPAAAAFLAQMRIDTGRQPGDTLHWRNIKAHPDKLHLAKRLGEQPWATLSRVVVCKRHLSSELTDDQAYLYTFRFLLERLSWLARDSDRKLHYTLAHIVRFKLERLREYESRLRNEQGCQVAWPSVDPRGGRLEQPNRVEMLQAADVVASATFAAIEPDRHGNTEQRYLVEMAPRLYRRGSAALTSYGFKMHPWNDATRAAHPWVAAL